jgi:peptide/nickel transport system permease protein
MAFLTLLLRKRLLGLMLVVFGVSLITFSISHLILATLPD